MATVLKAQSKAISGSTAPDIAAMTWLEAAEHILKQEGPEMHIKDLTERVLSLGMVNSHCRTSLETLLYRQVTHYMVNYLLLYFINSLINLIPNLKES